MKIRTFIIGLSFLLFSSANVAEEKSCFDGATLERLKCINKKLIELDEELNAVYKLAIDSMPKVNKSDSRKEQAQLRKSQRAWLKYKYENCNLIGGFKGGSNPWVSFFAADCERNEVKKRIEFLKKVASGTFKH